MEQLDASRKIGEYKMKIEFDTNSEKGKKKLFTIALVILALILYVYAGYLIFQQNTGCEYCEDPIRTHSYDGIDGAEYKTWPIHSQDEGTFNITYDSDLGWYLTVEEYWGFGFSPEIKYCPLCGGKLKPVK